MIDYRQLAERALEGAAPSREEALEILEGPDSELLQLLDAAYAPRRKHFGREVMVHVLNNVQNGMCAEDCGYCSQNRDSTAEIRSYPMKRTEEILAEGRTTAALFPDPDSLANDVVYPAHAEIEGGVYLEDFRSWLRRCLDKGGHFVSLSEMDESLRTAWSTLEIRNVVTAPIAGRPDPVSTGYPEECRTTSALVTDD